MNNGYHKQASQNENSINNIEELPFTNVVLSGTHFIALTTTKNICIPHHRVLRRTHSVFFFYLGAFMVGNITLGPVIYILLIKV